MAYFFNNAQRITASAPITGKPVTIAIRAYQTALDGESGLAYLGTVSGSNRVQITSDSPADTYRIAEVGTSVGQTTGIAISGYNTWFFSAGVFSSATDRTGYIDTTSQNNTTTSGTATTWDTVAIGARASSGAWAYYFTGRLAEAAVWDVALTAAEIDSLYKGFKPTRVRPQSLKFYSPLIRNLQDVRGGLTLTNNNSATVADHPRVY